MFQPWLEDKIKHSWVDPRKAKSDKDLLYQYKTAWAFAQAAEEILAFVQKMQEEAEALTKKEKGEVENKLRDAVS